MACRSCHDAGLTLDGLIPSHVQRGDVDDGVALVRVTRGDAEHRRARRAT